MIKIIVDCFGGDYSPEANVQGAIDSLALYPDLHLILSGDEKIIKEQLHGKTYDRQRVEILHAPQVIGCDERPTDVIRLKRDSSMVKGIRLLRDDDSIAAMVSTGSTGALVAAALTRIGRLQGVIRPAFCPILPTMSGGIVGVCDSGANVEVTPDHLRQFAIMSSLYMENIYGIYKPRVALLNVGKESEKGDELRQTAFKLLEETPEINFVGNMESRDLLSGNYDVVVADGFSGNVLVKATEGAALELYDKVKTDIRSRFINKVGAVLMARTLRAEKEFMDYQNYGGSVLLGTSKVIVKGHGSSKAKAVQKCIEQAYKMQLSDLGEKVEEVICRYDHFEQ